MTHEVYVLCNCDEEPCRMERYVSDVRIAYAENEHLKEVLARVETANLT
jgi:hypothetical protein